MIGYYILKDVNRHYLYFEIQPNKTVYLIKKVEKECKPTTEIFTETIESKTFEIDHPIVIEGQTDLGDVSHDIISLVSDTCHFSLSYDQENGSLNCTFLCETNWYDYAHNIEEVEIGKIKDDKIKYQVVLTGSNIYGTVNDAYQFEIILDDLIKAFMLVDLAFKDVYCELNELFYAYKWCVEEQVHHDYLTIRRVPKLKTPYTIELMTQDKMIITLQPNTNSKLACIEMEVENAFSGIQIQ